MKHLIFLTFLNISIFSMQLTNRLESFITKPALLILMRQFHGGVFPGALFSMPSNEFLPKRKNYTEDILDAKAELNGLLMMPVTQLKCDDPECNKIKQSENADYEDRMISCKLKIASNLIKLLCSHVAEKNSKYLAYRKISLSLATTSAIITAGSVIYGFAVPNTITFGVYPFLSFALCQSAAALADAHVNAMYKSEALVSKAVADTFYSASGNETINGAYEKAIKAVEEQHMPNYIKRDLIKKFKKDLTALS